MQHNETWWWWYICTFWNIITANKKIPKQKEKLSWFQFWKKSFRPRPQKPEEKKEFSNEDGWAGNVATWGSRLNPTFLRRNSSVKFTLMVKMGERCEVFFGSPLSLSSRADHMFDKCFEPQKPLRGPQDSQRTHKVQHNVSSSSSSALGSKVSFFIIITAPTSLSRVTRGA